MIILKKPLVDFYLANKDKIIAKKYGKLNKSNFVTAELDFCNETYTALYYILISEHDKHLFKKKNGSLSIPGIKKYYTNELPSGTFVFFPSIGYLEDNQYDKIKFIHFDP